MIRRPSYLFLGLLIWLGLEFTAFWMVVQLSGLAGALVLALLTTLAGVAVLRHLGRGALKALRTAMEGQELQSSRMLDGALTALGAALLILPGFVSDLAGLMLAAPSLRQWVARRFGGATLKPRPSSKPDILDLNPEEWQSIEETVGRSTRGAKKAKLRDQTASTL